MLVFKAKKTKKTKKNKKQQQPFFRILMYCLVTDRAYNNMS